MNDLIDTVRCETKEGAAAAVRLIAALLDDPDGRLYQAWLLMGESEREEALETIAFVIEETVDAAKREFALKVAADL